MEQAAVVDDMETLRGALSVGIIAITELMADHATFKTAVDQTETLVEELHDDHATLKTSHDGMETLIEEMHDDHATVKTALAALKAYMSHMALSDGGVGIGTTVQKVRSNATISYLIAGEFKSKASTDDLWTLSGTTITDGNFNKYLLCLDTSGAASIVEGTQGASAGAVVLPAYPSAKSVVGMLTVQTVGATFVPGTTALDAATVTDTYFDGAPDELLTAGPATLATGKPASGPATLTAAKPASAPATLAASVPSATAVDTAGDLVAAKIGDAAGVALTSYGVGAVSHNL